MDLFFVYSLYYHDHQNIEEIARYLTGNKLVKIIVKETDPTITKILLSVWTSHKLVTLEINLWYKAGK